MTRRTDPKKNVTFSSTPLLAGGLSIGRSKFVVFLVFIAFVALAARAFWIAGPDNAFYVKQGDDRIVRNLALPATRGEITDRNGLLLATSLPVQAIWADPHDMDDDLNIGKVDQMAKLLDISEQDLRSKFSRDKGFVYVKRQVPMNIADQVKALDLPGIFETREYKRYYPEGDLTAQLVGFTNVNDKGQDGVELAQDSRLHATDGLRSVIHDRSGNAIQDIAELKAPENGKRIQLSIDSKIQYIAASALKDAVLSSHAKAGAAIVVDAHTGEILALTNYPTYDPNDRAVLTGAQLRNRVMTDVFEPGSIMKPFTVSLALDLHRVTPNTTVVTSGRYVLDGATITDDANFGVLTIGGVIQKSSNIGATKISMLLKPEEMWNMYTALGIGKAPDLKFPGMGVGTLRPWKTWRRIEQATMSYGYGLSVSLFELAHAYTVFANNGHLVPLTIYKKPADEANTDPAQTPQIFAPDTMSEVRKMLENVVVPGGTAPQAQVPGYSVGGKTGTAYTATSHGYDRSRYRASFVGLIPIHNPRLVIAVSVDQPQGARHFGGDVSGPVFSSIGGDAMRALDIPPDIPLTPEQQKAQAASAVQTESKSAQMAEAGAHATPDMGRDAYITDKDGTARAAPRIAMADTKVAEQTAHDKATAQPVHEIPRKASSDPARNMPRGAAYANHTLSSRSVATTHTAFSAASHVARQTPLQSENNTRDTRQQQEDLARAKAVMGG
jgi:cell division protein FtsI (penicillin-binding protein 3)